AMTFSIKHILLPALLALFVAGCGHDDGHGHEEEGHGEEHSHEEEGHRHEEEDHGGHDEHAEEGQSIHLSAAQYSALQMETGPLPKRNLTNMVQANGTLEVPPKNEATVTAILGANVASIEVIEGDDVRKGQVLAYLSHPSITGLQREYLEAYNEEAYLQHEFDRQKKLYEAEVGSGKAYQQVTARYRSAQAAVYSYEAQLKQLGMRPARIAEGNFYTRIPLLSPIDGAITKVEVKTGQYVQPEKDLFEIINTDHIHADLMVFEKDVHKVSEGQRVRFTVESMPDQDIYANVYSVGKSFEQDPKAVHVHAEIENKTGRLIPGMYVRGEIMTDSATTPALPESAIAREGDDYLAFMAEKEGSGENTEWMFTPVRISTGDPAGNWMAVQFLDEVPENAQFALNNAYYLIAEMNKGEGGHHH
ncbi:MAG: efflux RND transporter periplasmic adaptor subunit, partial [Cyclobacteriaceae bacterium]